MRNKQKAIVKQLIAVVFLLLIQDAPEIIHCTCAIFDFAILVQYLLYDNETLFDMNHTLYKLYKTKIAFKNHCLINVKLFPSTLNYLKFYVITYLDK